MKIGFCTNVFADDALFSAMKSLREMGYDGVELWDNTLRNTDLLRLRDFLFDIGLEALQVCPYFNMTGTREELAHTMDIARDYLSIAETLGCGLIRTFTGTMSSDSAAPPVYEQAVKALRKICASGRERGISFALETHEGSLMDTGPATLRLLRDVDAENLKVNLQVPLDGGREDVFQSASLLGMHTVHIHAHNWIGSSPNFTLLSEGDLDFERFLLVLQGQGFDGTVSIEHGNHSGLLPLEIAQREIMYLKQLRQSWPKG